MCIRDRVRVGKVYSFTVYANSIDEAKSIVNEICQRLLANPVKDKFFVSVLNHEV